MQLGNTSGGIVNVGSEKANQLFNSYYDKLLIVNPERKMTVDNLIASNSSHYPSAWRSVAGMGGTDPNHPINNLQNIWCEMKDKFNKSKRIKRLERKRKRQVFSEDLSINKKNVIDQQTDVLSPKSQVNDFCQEEVESLSNNTELELPDSDFTNVQNSKKKHEISIVSDEHLNSCKISLNEIRNLPRFSNYLPGDPSKSLYLKNLSSKTTTDDLVAIFQRFQKLDKEKIIYHLLYGKMRGQAFVKFGSVETSKLALELVNGFMLKGKPIIIEFCRT